MTSPIGYNPKAVSNSLIRKTRQRVLFTTNNNNQSIDDLSSWLLSTAIGAFIGVIAIGIFDVK